MDLLKIDADSIPHDALLVALLSSGLRAKAGTDTTGRAPAEHRQSTGSPRPGQVLHTEIGPWFPPPAQYWRDYASHMLRNN